LYAIAGTNAHVWNNPQAFDLLIGNHRHERRTNAVLSEQFGGTGRCIVENQLDFAMVLPVEE